MAGERVKEQLEKGKERRAGAAAAIKERREDIFEKVKEKKGRRALAITLVVGVVIIMIVYYLLRWARLKLPEIGDPCLAMPEDCKCKFAAQCTKCNDFRQCTGYSTLDCCDKMPNDCRCDNCDDDRQCTPFSKCSKHGSYSAYDPRCYALGLSQLTGKDPCPTSSDLCGKIILE